LKALGGKKEGLKIAASSKEAGLQDTCNTEEGQKRWWRGWIAKSSKKRYLSIFLSIFLSVNPTRDLHKKITFFNHVY
jgi:hypothetical protein